LFTIGRYISDRYRVSSYFIKKSSQSNFLFAIKNSLIVIELQQVSIFQAIITIDGVNAATDYGISGATDLMAALKSVSDVGKRVVDEVSAFAETVLQLAERQDELAVAIADKERALAEESTYK
jgi:hypothetical protein